MNHNINPRKGPRQSIPVSHIPEKKPKRWMEMWAKILLHLILLEFVS